MSKLEDFNESDLVQHILNGHGIVEVIIDGRVVVYFPDAKPKPFRGTYDRDWFRMHPEMLDRI